jgi:hypothetical protein
VKKVWARLKSNIIFLQLISPSITRAWLKKKKRRKKIAAWQGLSFKHVGQTSIFLEYILSHPQDPNMLFSFFEEYFDFTASRL